VKPLQLRLRAFGPYPEALVVDFEQLSEYGNLFLIHGPTGAGKSTVLDGMTYALYGNTRGDQGPERGGREFITTLNGGVARDDDHRTRAELVFTVAGERYRVVRYPQQAVLRKRRREGVEEGRGSVERGPEARLERLALDGSVVAELASGEREVTEQVEQRLGATVAQFRQTVVLPQGEFRKVVTDKEERLGVLRTIFATERFTRLAEALNRLKLDSASRSKGLRGEVERALADADVERLEELAPALAAAQAASERAHAVVQGLEGEQRVLQRRAGEAEQLAQRFLRLADLRREAAELAARVPAMEVGAVALLRYRRARRAKPAVEALRTQEEAHAAAAATAVRAAGELERARSELAAAEQRATARATEFGSRDALLNRVAELRRLAPEVAGLAELEAAHRAAAAALEMRTAEVGGQQADLDNLEQRSLENRSEQQSLRELGDSLLACHQARSASEARLRDRRTVARLERELVDSRASFAAQRPEAAEFDAGRAYAGHSLEGYLEAVAPAIAAGREPAAHAAATIRSVHQLELDATAFRAGLEPVIGRIRELAAEHGWQETPPSVADLEAELAAAQTRFAAAEDAQTRIGELTTASERIERERTELQRSLTAANEALQGLRTEAATLGFDLEGLRNRLPADARDAVAFRQRLEALEADLSSQERLDAEVGSLTAVVATAQGAAEAGNAALQSAAELLAERTAALAAALSEAGYASLTEWSLDLRSDEEIDAEAEAQRDFAQARESNRTETASLERDLADRSEPDLSALTTELAALEVRLAEANGERIAAELHRGSLESTAARVRAARERLAAMEARESSLTRLANLAMGGSRGLSFEMFVLRRQFLEVLAAGNHHLQRMTRQRYTFHLVEEAGKRDGLDLEVADHHNGAVRRPAKTLSGGEGFLAALALALGLSESAQRAKHPIEALFIDEGFGSLDSATLAQVTQTLRTLPAVAGRLVGIISHVEDLKRLIPVQLVVSPGANGSALRVAFNRGEGDA
jgi:exonuclease SbcC